jgi:hypothetical protein
MFTKKNNVETPIVGVVSFTQAVELQALMDEKVEQREIINNKIANLDIAKVADEATENAQKYSEASQELNLVLSPDVKVRDLVRILETNSVIKDYFDYNKKEMDFGVKQPLLKDNKLAQDFFYHLRDYLIFQSIEQTKIAVNPAGSLDEFKKELGAVNNDIKQCEEDLSQFDAVRDSAIAVLQQMRNELHHYSTNIQIKFNNEKPKDEKEIAMYQAKKNFLDNIIKKQEKAINSKNFNDIHNAFKITYEKFSCENKDIIIAQHQKSSIINGMKPATGNGVVNKIKDIMKHSQIEQAVKLETPNKKFGIKG